MELMEAIYGRRSVRKFKREPVQEEDLQKILEAARWAANAGNSQPWHFLVIRGEELRDRMAQAVNFRSVAARDPRSRQEREEFLCLLLAPLF